MYGVALRIAVKGKVKRLVIVIFEKALLIAAAAASLVGEILMRGCARPLVPRCIWRGGGPQRAHGLFERRLLPLLPGDSG